MRRNVDALARYLENPTTGGVGDDVRALAQLAQALDLGPATPSEEFKACLRASLLEQAPSGNASPLLRLRVAFECATERWYYSARLAALTAAAAFALSGGGLAVAADQAPPGGALYGMKLTLEDVRTFFVRGDVDRGQAHLAHAAERLGESKLAAAEGNHAGAAWALREADESLRDGARHLLGAFMASDDRAPLDLLAGAVTNARREATDLDALVEGDARPALADLRVTLDRIDQRIHELSAGCKTCGRGSPVRQGEGFDFSIIPAADEPFQPCPCVPEATAAATAATPARRAAGAQSQDAPPAATPAGSPRSDEPQGRPGTPPPSDPAPAPTPPPEPPPRVIPDVPGPADDVVDDLLRRILGDPDPLPPPPTAGTDAAPDAAVPTEARVAATPAPAAPAGVTHEQFTDPQPARERATASPTPGPRTTSADAPTTPLERLTESVRRVVGL